MRLVEQVPQVLGAQEETEKLFSPKSKLKPLPRWQSRKVPGVETLSMKRRSASPQKGLSTTKSWGSLRLPDLPPLVEVVEASKPIDDDVEAPATRDDDDEAPHSCTQ